MSSALIAIFLTVACFLAWTSTPSSLVDLASHVWREPSWVYSTGVSWQGSASLLSPGPQQWPDGVDPPIIASSSDNEDFETVPAGQDADEEGKGYEDEDAAAQSGGPDLDRYVWHRDLKWDATTAKGRLIIVGDVHGMIGSLRNLLDRLHFDQDADTLVLVGDLVAKAPDINDSTAVVTYAREMGAKAVRGNHDQMVIGYRLWMEHNTLADVAFTSNATWLAAESEPSELRAKLPKGWKWRSQHFEIARQLSAADFRWLLNRSLTLHIRSLHAYVVHAGVLPATVPRNSKSAGQAEEGEDLESTSPYSFEPDARTESRMNIEDTAILLKSQNRRPKTLLYMRGVTKHGTRPHADGHKGVPWSGIWDGAMTDCESDANDCRALSVVYGHWAARDLLIERHAIGLDSGCVYGRRLSALVLEADGATAAQRHDKSLETTNVHFGGRVGVVYSMKCPKP